MSHYDHSSAAEFNDYLRSHPSLTIFVLAVVSSLLTLYHPITTIFAILSALFIIWGIVLSVREHQRDELRHDLMMHMATSHQYMYDMMATMETLHGGRVYKGTMREFAAEQEEG